MSGGTKRKPFGGVSGHLNAVAFASYTTSICKKIDDIGEGGRRALRSTGRVTSHMCLQGVLFARDTVREDLNLDKD